MLGAVGGLLAFQYPLRVNSLSSITRFPSFFGAFEFQYPLRVNSLSSVEVFHAAPLDEVFQYPLRVNSLSSNGAYTMSVYINSVSVPSTGQ